MDIRLEILNIPPDQVSPTIREIKAALTAPSEYEKALFQIYQERQTNASLKPASPTLTFAEEFNPASVDRALPTSSAHPASTVIQVPSASAEPKSSRFSNNEEELSQSWINRVISNDRCFVGLLILAIVCGSLLYTRQNPLQWFSPTPQNAKPVSKPTR